MSCRFVWCLVTAILLSFSAACFGQTVTIRVINIANGNPLGNQPVAISLLHEGGSTDKPNLSLLTDANGEAEFELPKPPPPHFAVRVSLNDARWYCDCLALVTTEDVMQKGLLTRSPDNEGTRTAPVLKQEPGEILFRARSTPWWVRLLYPLVKD